MTHCLFSTLSLPSFLPHLGSSPFDYFSCFSDEGSNILSFDTQLFLKVGEMAQMVQSPGHMGMDTWALGDHPLLQAHWL